MSYSFKSTFVRHRIFLPPSASASSGVPSEYFSTISAMLAVASPPFPTFRLSVSGFQPIRYLASIPWLALPALVFPGAPPVLTAAELPFGAAVMPVPLPEDCPPEVPVVRVVPVDLAAFTVLLPGSFTVDPVPLPEDLLPDLLS